MSQNVFPVNFKTPNRCYLHVYALLLIDAQQVMTYITI